MDTKYQVFVSSTYSDLREERQACVEAILTAGHIPAGMELFSAGSETQLEIIKRWIDESDIYMLLLGGRYGTLDPKSELSYTEVEYRYATEQNKPVFALVMDEKYVDEKLKIAGRKVLELENTSKYDEFRKLVLSKIVKYFINSDQLKLGVIQSLVDIQRRYTLSGWVRKEDSLDTVQILNQLSSLTEINRSLEEKVKNLKEQLSYSSDISIDSLTNEQRIMLTAASTSNMKGIIKTRHNIFIDSKAYLDGIDVHRTKVIWEDAFTGLITMELIRIHHNLADGKYYELTSLGYQIADEISEKSDT
jgi:hypothetical protein